MLQLILSLMIVILAFLVGWRLSKYYYRVNQMLELIDLMGEVLQDNITQEEAAKRFKKIKL